MCNNSEMKASAIVILNYNGEKMLQQYLPTVLLNSQSDVIVADNASTDGSLQLMRTQFPDVPLLVLDRNYGFAEGYNRALAQLPQYRYYLLLNSDVEIRQPQWDAPLIAYMDTHPLCAACQPKLLKLVPQGDAPDTFEYAGAAGGFLDRYGYPYCRGRIFSVVEEDHSQYDDTISLHWATGAALMVRAEDWRESGGLDGRFFAHMEEIDLCWRLRLMGKDIVCVPTSTAYHLGGGTLNQGNPRKTFLNFRNNLLMLYKNLPEDRLFPVMRMRHLLDTLASFQFLLKGDTANFRAILRARREYQKIRSQFTADRQRIQSNRKETLIPENVDVSVLWQFYAKGKKTWKQL